MNQNEYKMPNMEVLRIESIDVITTSGDKADTEWNVG